MASDADELKQPRQSSVADKEDLLLHVFDVVEQLSPSKKMRTAGKNLLFGALNYEASLAWSAIVTDYTDKYASEWGTWLSVLVLSFVSVWACFLFYDVAEALRAQAAERRNQRLDDAQTKVVTQGLDSVVDALGFVLAVAWDQLTAEVLGLRDWSEWYWRGLYAVGASLSWPFIVILWNTLLPRILKVTSGSYTDVSAERVKKLSSIWLSSGAWIVAFGWLRVFEQVSREIFDTSAGTDSDLLRQWLVAVGVFIFSLFFWAALRRVNVPPLPAYYSWWRRLWQRQKGAFVRSSSVSCKYVGVLAVRFAIQASMEPVSVASIVYCCLISLATVMLTLAFDKYSQPITPRQGGGGGGGGSGGGGSTERSRSGSSEGKPTTATGLLPAKWELAEDPLMISSGFPSTFPQFLLQDFTLLSTYAFDFVVGGYLRTHNYSSNMWLYAFIMTGVAVIAPKVLTCHPQPETPPKLDASAPATDPQVMISILQLQVEDLKRENDSLRLQLALHD